MSSDLTFITNEDGNTLLDRFDTLVKDTTLFDCLVGYFYSSGFYALEKALENTEKIRILIGISTNKMTYDLIQAASFEGLRGIQHSSFPARILGVNTPAWSRKS